MNLIQELRGDVKFLPRAGAYTSPQVDVRHADGTLSAVNAYIRFWERANKGECGC
jgi:hypothetical protein